MQGQAPCVFTLQMKCEGMFMEQRWLQCKASR